MKIIFLINSTFPYYAGGIETWLYNVSKGICEEHEVTIVSKSGQPMSTMFPSISDRIKIINYKTLLDYPVVKHLIHSYLKVLNQYFGIYTRSRVLKKELSLDKDIYVVALDTLFNPPSALRLRKKYPRMRVICSSRGPHVAVMSSAYPALKHFFDRQETRNLKASHAVWANGYDTLKYITQKKVPAVLMRNGVDIKKIVEHNSSGAPEIQAGDGKKRIITVASLLDIKHIYEQIDALALLRKKGRDEFEYYFIGKGNQDKYKNYAESCGLADCIHFLGHKSNVGDYMKKGDVLTCLCTGGGMSMAALESMASGIPVIAWDILKYQQFNCDKKTLVLIPEEDTQALADAILDIADHTEQYVELTQNAVQVALEYDWSNIVNEFVLNLEGVSS